MSVHYKFKSALDFDTVTFDGLNISVGDLKRAIIQQKRLGKVTDFDLQITNAQTKEEYQDDSTLIPKNTSLIIARIPISQPKKTWNPQNVEKTQQTRSTARGDGNSLDLSKMKGSEEDKILEMMIQSTAEYDPKSYHRIRGHSQLGEVPPSYRCNKCKKSGHWIKNCPYIMGKDHSDVKRNTGIPRSFLDKDDKESAADFPEPPTAIETQKEIPEELVCSICKDLFVDAVMIPCCGSSFCDDCVRCALLESEDNECPDCKEKGCSPGSLIPNRFLRNSVNSFKNENGYTNLRGKKGIVETPKPQEPPEKPQEPQETIPDKVISEEIAVNKDEEKPKEVSSSNATTKSVPDEEANDNDAENSSKADTTSKAEEVESDYEDNITIKMPPIPVKTPNTAEHTGRSISHPKPPGIENSPRHKLQVSPTDSQKRDSHHGSDSQSNDWDNDYKSEREYPEEDTNGNVFYKKSHNHPMNPQMHYGSNKIQPRPSRPHHLIDVYAGPPNRVHAYPQMPVPHGMPQDPTAQGQPMMPFGVYNPMGPRPNVGYQHSVRPMYHNGPPGFPPIRCPPADIHHANSNLASVYQGVAAKVGPGIIEDPLETFNRLMKEKERRREERRRSMERRRSWSHERQHRGRVHTSPYHRGPREAKDKARPHETERNRDNGFERNKGTRRRRSNSFSDKSSRSRSWSKSPVKKRSRSPYKKRSRSRTRTFPEKPHEIGKGHDTREEDAHQELTITRRSTSEERARLMRQSNAEWYPHITSFDSERYPSARRDIRFQENQHETLEPPPPGYETNQSAYNSNYNASQQSYAKQRHRTERERMASDAKDRRHLECRHSPSDKADTRVSNKPTEKKIRRSRTRTPELKKRTDGGEKLDKNTNRRLRNNFSISRKSADRNKTDDPHKRTAISFNETYKRSHEKHEKHNEKHLKSTEEVVISKDEGQSSLSTHAKGDKIESVERLSTPEKHSRSRRDTSTKEDDVNSPSSKEEKISKKLKEKERKKKRKEKNEKKKLKKEKKSKRDKERQKLTPDLDEIKQGDDENDDSKDNYISRTPELIPKKAITTEEDAVVTLEESKTTDVNTACIIDDTVDVDAISPKNKEGLDLENPDKTEDGDTNANNTEFKRVDSILDILDYETEFDELHTQNQNQQNQKNLTPAPEPSKWEIDEPVNSVASEVINLETIDCTDDHDENIPNEKITNEVLRKAENAIFARAIKAIYPYDKLDANNDHQRGGVYNDMLPRMGSKDKIKNFEITVPASNSQERSVQIKDDKSSRSPKIVKSVKDRLGSKITVNYAFSPVRESTTRSQIVKSSSIGRSAIERAEEKNRDRDKREKRLNHDNRDRSRNITTPSHRDRDRDRNRDGDRERELERERERERNRNRDREREHNRERDRDRDKNQENDKYRNRDRERTRDRERDQVRGNRQQSPRHLSRNKDTFSASRLHNKNRGDEESANSAIKRRESTPSNSKDSRVKAKKRSYDERDASSSSNKNVTKKRSISKERNKNDRTVYAKKTSIESENRTNVHNSSACSSSGSADTSSDSDSDDGKRKKKHKYKKDKKRSKRSASAESTGSSSKEKHGKKKRSKTSKKKKKNKK